MELEDYFTAVVPSVEMEVVENNSKVDLASVNSGIENTSISTNVGHGPAPVTFGDVVDIDDRYLPGPLLGKEDN